MKIVVAISYLLVFSFVSFSQEGSYKIPLQVNYASDFDFIKNRNGFGCLFLDLGDSYCITIVDSNYNVHAQFKDRYYLAKEPSYIGSLANKEGFELFFRRFEEDILLVLKINIDKREITRIKDFKISNYSKEKIIFTGSYFSSDSMFTISTSSSGLLHKKHLSGLAMDITNIHLQELDKEIFKKHEFSYINFDSDSLIMLYKINDVRYKNPLYVVFNIDLKKRTYGKTEISPNKKWFEQNINATIFKNTVVIFDNGFDIKIFNRFNGELLNEFDITIDSIIQNEKIDILKYNYTSTFLIDSVSHHYSYLHGNEREKLSIYYSSKNFYEDSTGIYLEVKGKERVFDIINESYNRYIAYIPFDWKKKSVDYNATNKPLNVYDYTIHNIEVRKNPKIKLSGYFIGINDEVLYGYILKKRKEFIIEKVDL